jgi:hypothetical protein
LISDTSSGHPERPWRRGSDACCRDLRFCNGRHERPIAARCGAIDDVFRDGKKVGTAGGACTAVRATASAIQYHCQASVRLPKGQLSGQLLAWTSQPTLTYAITGGTGAYRDAGGYATVPNTQDPTYPVTVFLEHLQR